MARLLPLDRTGVLYAGSALVSASGVWLAVTSGPSLFAVGLLLILAGPFAIILNLRRRLRAVSAAAASTPGVEEVARPDLARRLTLAHPVSGLPLREALLARMNADQVGVLGAIAFADFERLRSGCGS